MPCGTAFVKPHNATPTFRGKYVDLNYPSLICLRLRRHPVGGRSGTRLRNGVCVRTSWPWITFRPMRLVHITAFGQTAYNGVSMGRTGRSPAGSGSGTPGCVGRNHQAWPGRYCRGACSCILPSGLEGGRRCHPGASRDEKPADVEVISIAIRSVYLPWAEASARYLQKVVEGSSYPGGTIDASTPVPRQAGECVFRRWPAL